MKSKKRNESVQYFHNLDEGMLRILSRVTGQKLPTLPPQPKLTDFYHPSQNGTKKRRVGIYYFWRTVLLSYVIFKYI